MTQKDVFAFIDLQIPLMPEITQKIEASESNSQKLSNLQRLQLQSPTELKNMQDTQLTKFKTNMIDSCIQEMR